MKAPAPSLTSKQSHREQRLSRFNVEFFHVYSDETIGEHHAKGLEYLRTIEKAWSSEYDRIILLDNYNPTSHTLTIDKVLEHLNEQGMLPDYWAYEKDLINNAQQLLTQLTHPKLKRNYENYIKKNHKYPCSLLTASWYLTRLGKFEHKGIIKAVSKRKNKQYKPAERLLNVLPRDYSRLEKRARELILKSQFAKEADKVQDLFYSADPGRELALF